MAVPTHRIVIMGSGGVGKTSLISRFMTGQFPYGYYPTIENVYKHQIQMPDGATHSLELVDTAGLHIVPSMQKLCIKSGKAFMLVYDIDNVMSFLNALDLVEEINIIKGVNSRTPIILVGNRCESTANREVDTIEAQTESAQRNCTSIEVSAKENINVNEAFMELLQKLIPGNPQQSRKKKGKDVKKSKSKEPISSTSNGNSGGDTGGGGGGGLAGNKDVKDGKSLDKNSDKKSASSDKDKEPKTEEGAADKKEKQKGKDCVIS